MDKDRRKIDYHEHEAPDPALFPDLSNVASAQECTGLMHKSPQDGAEWESYQQLSSMAVPREETSVRPEKGFGKGPAGKPQAE